MMGCVISPLLCDDTPSASRHINFFEPFHFLAGDQRVVPIGVSHISLWLQEIQSREWEEREQTNKMPGVNSSARRELCNTAFPVCICRRTLAWISSETSTKLLGMLTHLEQSSSLLWTSSHQTGLSAVRCQLPTRVTLRQLPSSSSFVQLPSRVPLPTSSHDEISSPKPFVWFRAKTDKGIVCLADLLHSVTTFRIGNGDNIL